MRALPASPLFCVASAPAAAARRALPLAAEPPGWPRALRASLATASERCVAARASETDSEAQPAAVDEAPKQPRVFASRARKDAPEPPRLDRPRLEPRGVDEQPRAASPATPAAERQFGRFARDASGNFARPGGAPPAPEDDRPPPRAFTSGAGGPREGGGGRFGGPAFGQRGAPGGAAAAPGRGGGVRTAERDKLGRKGRADDGPATFGRAATEARRNARATRKEERSNKTTKKERVEFLELPPQGLSVEELADKLALNSADIIKALFLKGIMTTVNMILDKEKVLLLAKEFEVEVLEEDEIAVGDLARKTTSYNLDEDDLDFLQPRAPVVTIMGHVDHGKTSLLDFIRKTRVAAGEAGGITQAIGAYQVSPLIGGVSTPITFLDTPGHEAFSAMRARGARVTDIAVIMVAADDGVRPQTLEAISHAQAAGVPMVVALNKIDKEGANPERVKQELSAAGLLPEEWGGTTPVVPISAKKGTGIDALLETIQLVAEMSELLANPQRSACGTVVEAYMDKTRGATATLLVQAGTLRVGDVVVCGPAFGRVRALVSDAGERVTEALPSTPVQLLGLDCVPAAGDEFQVCADEDEARELAIDARERLLAERLQEQSSGQTQLVGSASEQAGDESLKRLNIVLKTDVSGSVEAIKNATSTIVQERVQLRFLTAAAGEVSASDIDLASASDALVLAFNLAIPEEVAVRAKQKGVDARAYDVIYALVDDVKLEMESMLKPVTERVPLGEAEVRGVFGSGTTGKVAGCMVTSGKLVTKCQICVKRGKEVVFEGRMESLRRMKDVVKEVGLGYECGVGSEFTGWKEGDKIEAFDLVTKRVILPLKGDGASKAEKAAAAAAAEKIAAAEAVAAA